MSESVTITVPKAFSVRDEAEFLAFQHLMTRLNPDLCVVEIAQGLHKDGGATKFWGAVFCREAMPSDSELAQVLEDAGLDYNSVIKHNNWPSNNK